MMWPAASSVNNPRSVSMSPLLKALYAVRSTSSFGCAIVPPSRSVAAILPPGGPPGQLPAPPAVSPVGPATVTPVPAGPVTMPPRLLALDPGPSRRALDVASRQARDGDRAEGGRRDRRDLQPAMRRAHQEHVFGPVVQDDPDDVPGGPGGGPPPQPDPRAGAARPDEPRPSRPSRSRRGVRR